MTDTRTYIRVHDGMADHPKIDALSDRAFRLLIESWCWCSRHLTDGRIPEPTWAKRGTPAARRELEVAGLVEVGPDGTRIMHDYLEHQRSADEVAAMREQRREAGRKGGQAKAARLANAKRPAKRVAKQTSSKSVASTETDTDTASNEAVDVSDGSAEPTAQTLVGEWIDACETRPPGRVVGHVARELGAMLAENVPYDVVRSGLIAWHGKNLGPASLASVVHETQRKATARPADDNSWMRRTL